MKNSPNAVCLPCSPGQALAPQPLRGRAAWASSLGTTGLFAVALAFSLPAQTIPPGVPEPGLVIWGTVVNQTNPSQAITISSAAWSVTDGTKTAVYSALSRPATRIVNLGGQSYYILQVPFDTRQIGTVTLADPATVGIDSFALRSTSPPTYTLTPTINGALGTIRAVDGAPASGANVAVSGFASSARGRVIRVDLGIVPVLESYESWAARIFGSAGSAEAARTADPDGDGMNNESEYAAGSDPKDPNSALRILQLTLPSQPGPAVLNWQSAPNRNYLIEAASDPAGPWSSLGSLVPSAGASTQTGVDLGSGNTGRYYRVRLAPQ